MKLPWDDRNISHFTPLSEVKTLSNLDDKVYMPVTKYTLKIEKIIYFIKYKESNTSRRGNFTVRMSKLQTHKICSGG